MKKTSRSVKKKLNDDLKLNKPNRTYSKVESLDKNDDKLVVSAEVFDHFEKKNLLIKRKRSHSLHSSEKSLITTRSKSNLINNGKDKIDTKDETVDKKNNLIGARMKLTDILSRRKTIDISDINTMNLNSKPVKIQENTNTKEILIKQETDNINLSENKFKVGDLPDKTGTTNNNLLATSQVNSSSTATFKKQQIFIVKNSSGKSVPIVLKNKPIIVKSSAISCVLTNKQPVTTIKNLECNETIPKHLETENIEKTKIIPISDVNRSHIYFHPNVSHSKKNSEENNQKIDLIDLNKKYFENIRNPFNLKIDEIAPKPIKNILINNTLVPVNKNTKFNIETTTSGGLNTSSDDLRTINIITKKNIEPEVSKNVEDQSKLNIKKFKTIPKTVKIQPAEQLLIQNSGNQQNISKIDEKIYQLQVNKDILPSNNSANLKFETDFSKSKYRPPYVVKNYKNLDDSCINNVNDNKMALYVESWTQTPEIKKNTKEFACQTEPYVPQISNSIEKDPNITELVQYLLEVPEYSTGMDEIKKSDLIGLSKNIKTKSSTEMEINKKCNEIDLKKMLFYDLKGCIQFDFLGNMPIHNAVLDNNLIYLKRQCFALRLRQISVDIENNQGQTALQLAVVDNKNFEIISTLLGYGANVEVRDNLGNTLLHLAVLNSTKYVLELIMKYFIKLKDIIDTKNDEGLTPLMISAIEAKSEMVETLLKYGADPNARDDKSGRTALFHAVELNNNYVINLLLSFKADPKVRNFFGLTALDAAKDLEIPEANIMEYGQSSPSSINSNSSIKINKRPNQTAINYEPKKIKMSFVAKIEKVDLNSIKKRVINKTSNVNKNSNIVSDSNTNKTSTNLNGRRKKKN